MDHWNDKGIRPDMNLADYVGKKEVRTLRHMTDIAKDVYDIELQLLAKEGEDKETWMSEAKKMFAWFKLRFPEAEITISDSEGNHGWSYRGIGK